jgi:nucleoid DNA-binding protein
MARQRKPKGYGTPLEQVVYSVAEHAGVTKASARDLVDFVLEQIAAHVIIKGRFTWPEFGTWRVTSRSARKIRNPATLAIMDLPRQHSIAFRPSKALRLELREAQTYERRARS